MVPHLCDGGGHFMGPPKSPPGFPLSCLTRAPHRGPQARTTLHPCPGEAWPAAPSPTMSPSPGSFAVIQREPQLGARRPPQAPWHFGRNLEQDSDHECVLVLHASSSHLASGTPAPHVSEQRPCGACPLPSRVQARRQRSEAPRGLGHLQGRGERPLGHGLSMEW